LSVSYRSLPSLQTLKCFEAAARLGSFTLAAEELCITHSAISHQIRGLEKAIGQPLFKRVGNRMVLTLAGNTLSVETRRALDYLNQAYSVANVANLAKRDRLVFTTQFAIMEHFLLPRLQNLRGVTGEMALQFQTVADLAEQCPEETDVAFLYGTGEVPGMLSEKVADEEVFPVCSPDFLKDNVDLSPETLSDHSLLLHSRVTWNLWLEKGSLPIRYPSNALLFDDVALTIRGALGGLGIAMVRSKLVQDYLHSGQLLRLFDRSVPGVFSYYLGWKDEQTRLRHSKLKDWIVRSLI
jgi:LysR family glycine cleavage system transcriptional activator